KVPSQSKKSRGTPMPSSKRSGSAYGPFPSACATARSDACIAFMMAVESAALGALCAGMPGVEPPLGAFNESAPADVAFNESAPAALAFRESAPAALAFRESAPVVAAFWVSAPPCARAGSGHETIRRPVTRHAARRRLRAADGRRAPERGPRLME